MRVGYQKHALSGKRYALLSAGRSYATTCNVICLPQSWTKMLCKIACYGFQPSIRASVMLTGSSVMMASSPLPMPLCTNSLAAYLDREHTRTYIS